MAKKKKNKQPAKKRNRGKVIELNRSFLDESVNLEEKQTLKKFHKKYYLPIDTTKILENVKKIDNFSLYLNKIEVYNFENKKNKLPKPFVPENYERIAQNYYKKIEQLNLIRDKLELIADERLIIGLGGASVYETSLTLHHIYGVPYIPGSAIKGSFRSYLIEKRFNNNEKEAIDKDWFKKIFGSEKSQGKVIFFDAFPIGDLKIFKDIINPHYQDYYSDDKNKVYPTDDQSPVPIPFLVVEGKFKFVFGVKENLEIDIKGDKRKVLEFVKENLEKSLKEFGIGAKTAVGYGYFKK